MTILASVGIALGPSRNRGQGQQGPLVGLGHSHSLGYGMSGHFNARNSVFELIGLLVADSSTALLPKDSLVLISVAFEVLGGDFAKILLGVGVICPKDSKYPGTK